MASTNIRWPVVRGEDITLVLTGEDDTDPTGWSMEFYLSNYAGQTTPTFSTTTVTVGGGTGDDPFTLTIQMTRAETSDLTLTNYVWQVWRKDSGENVVLSSGTMTVSPPVRPPA